MNVSGVDETKHAPEFIRRQQMSNKDLLPSPLLGALEFPADTCKHDVGAIEIQLHFRERIVDVKAIKVLVANASHQAPI